MTQTMRAVRLPRISFHNRTGDSPGKGSPDARNFKRSLKRSAIEDMVAEDCPQDAIVAAIKAGWETARSVD